MFGFLTVSSHLFGFLVNFSQIGTIVQKNGRISHRYPNRYAWNGAGTPSGMNRQSAQAWHLRACPQSATLTAKLAVRIRHEAENGEVAGHYRPESAPRRYRRVGTDLAFFIFRSRTGHGLPVG
jgi:hypothetical protein